MLKTILICTLIIYFFIITFIFIVRYLKPNSEFQGSTTYGKTWENKKKFSKHKFRLNLTLKKAKPAKENCLVKTKVKLAKD